MTYIVHCVKLDYPKDEHDEFFKPEIVSGFTKMFDDIDRAMAYSSKIKRIDPYMDSCVYDAEWNVLQKLEHGYKTRLRHEKKSGWRPWRNLKRHTR